MSKELDILKLGDKKKHKRKLQAYQETVGKNPYVKNNPMATVIYTIVMKRLIDKANKEDSKNQKRRMSMFSDLSAKKESDERAAAQSKREEEERKYQRQRADHVADRDISYKRDLEKERRQRDYDTVKDARSLSHQVKHDKILKALDDSYKLKRDKRKLIGQTFADKSEGLEYMLNPEESEKKRTTFDSNPIYKRVIGKLKQRAGGKRYEPKLASTFRR